MLLWIILLTNFIDTSIWGQNKRKSIVHLRMSQEGESRSKASCQREKIRNRSEDHNLDTSKNKMHRDSESELEGRQGIKNSTELAGQLWGLKQELFSCRQLEIANIYKVLTLCLVCSDHWTYANSLNPHKSSLKQVLSLFQFYKKMKAQRGWLTFPKAHSQYILGPELESRESGSRVCALKNNTDCFSKLGLSCHLPESWHRLFILSLWMWTWKNIFLA